MWAVFLVLVGAVVSVTPLSASGSFSIPIALRYRLLTHQITSLTDLLASDCNWATDEVNSPFLPSDVSSPWWGISKRSVPQLTPTETASIELQIRLGTDLLGKLKEDYIACQLHAPTNGKNGPTRVPPTQPVPSSTPQPTTTESPTTVLRTLPPWAPKRPGPYAFRTIRQRDVEHFGEKFTVLQVELPANNQSLSENWCKDYENLCAAYRKKPTGCSLSGSSYRTCETLYDSKMTFDNTADPLQCPPLKGIQTLVYQSFGHLIDLSHVFGFFKCDAAHCQKDLSGSLVAFGHTTGSGLNSYDRSVYTVCA